MMEDSRTIVPRYSVITDLPQLIQKKDKDKMAVRQSESHL